MLLPGIKKPSIFTYGKARHLHVTIVNDVIPGLPQERRGM